MATVSQNMASHNPILFFRQGFSGFVTSDLYEAALAGKGTDMKFEIGDSRLILNAHTTVIRTQSKVLDVMLNETWTPTAPKQQKEEIVLKLPDDPQEFQVFLKYLYGNQELNTKNFDVVIPMWKLADKYGADNVLGLCLHYFEFLKRNFDRVDVGKLLPIAHEHRCEKLFEATMKHVKGNLHKYWNQHSNDYCTWPVEFVTEILSTDSIKLSNFTTWEKNESFLLFCAFRWLTANSARQNWSQEQKATVVTQVLEKIRFCQLDHVEFKRCMQLLLYRLLDDRQIALITLAHCGISEENILKSHGPNLAFKVDRRLRHPQLARNQN